MTLRVLAGLPPTFATNVVALSFTYALHSLAWWAAVVALARPGRPPSARHRLWKLALLGPCVTAPIAALAPWTFGLVVAPHVSSSSGPAEAARAAGASVFARPVWTASWLALGILAAAGLGLLRFALAFVRLRCRVRSRTPVLDARLLQRTEQLCARAGWPGVRITESAGIGSPLVLGRRELCVPRGMLQRLADPELAAVLGHELAHLERGDGVWFPIAGLLQSTLWLQPLNHHVASRLRETAELACDDRAVELSGDPLGLAHALVQVAERALGGGPRGLVPAMAGPPSVLGLRVRRLASAPRPPLRAPTVTERAGAIATVGACALASLFSSVRLAEVHPPAPARAIPTARADTSTARLEALVRRDRELQEQLALAGGRSYDHGDDRDLVAWKESREQELRHVRAEATWIERRLGSDAAP